MLHETAALFVKNEIPESYQIRAPNLFFINEISKSYKVCYKWDTKKLSDAAR